MTIINANLLIIVLDQKGLIVSEESEASKIIFSNFMLQEKNIYAIYHLEFFYHEYINNFIQVQLSGDNIVDFCNTEEIENSMNVIGLLAQIELFCYLESIRIIPSESMDTELGSIFLLLKSPRFIALRVYLQEKSFSYLVARLGGTIAINKILVYGTLKSGNEKNRYFGFDQSTKSLGIKKIAGKMFSVASKYPGAVLNLKDIFSETSEVSHSTFECELLEVIDATQSNLIDLFVRLDAYENEGDFQEYRRYFIPYGEQEEGAWLYHFIQDTTTLRRIESGIWEAL